MLQFRKLIVHNFGSYNHAEVDLQSRGFCLVSGQNNYKKDNALSNGSGKSFLWSAICFTITGETINGLHSNLKNINVDENLCYTTVEFGYDGDDYTLTRYIAPKSDLKITKNGQDLSAKGIRDSEKRLGELLPDITKDLLASTILIGQGMPNKFSSFSPSGRKELLEKLTKSDFMIEDVKTRVANRQTELAKKIREYEDSLIAHNTQRGMVQASFERENKEFSESARPDFDADIATTTAQIGPIKAKIFTLQADKLTIEKKVEELNQQLVGIVEEKGKMSREEFTAYSTAHSKLLADKASLEARITSLKKEIAKLQAITDVCPTCGQKLPNVIKPSTKAQEEELEVVKTQFGAVTAKLTACEQKHKQYLLDIDNTFDGQITEVKREASTRKAEALKLGNDILDLSTQREQLETKLSKLQYDKENWDKYYTTLQASVAHYKAALEKLDVLITTTTAAKNELVEHTNVLRKMDTLIKRDFRGYLLSNIIDYIDKKAKEYCKIVFETDELNVYLDGNALDISYCGKMFDGLSGGEKQRVDLILQFAIRDMLSSYLGFNANIIVLDEITDFLDKKSCKAIMKLLEKELNTIESVFLISHHADELELPIDSELKIVKNTDGISEVN